jgi:hypothetical protein
MYRSGLDIPRLEGGLADKESRHQEGQEHA